MTKVLIIVPAFNEEGNVGQAIDQIRRSSVACDVLVIDDGSTDQTALEASRHGAVVIRLPFNLGIGGAVQTGFQYAYAEGYDIAVQIDGDGQHDPSYLDMLIAPILSQEADLVVGSRFLADSGGFKSTFSRRVGIRFFVGLINLLTRMKITDPTSGFRAHNKKLIAAFASDYPHDFPEPEALVVARRANASVQEIPVVMRARRGGSSSIGSIKSIYYMLKVTVAILLQMMTPSNSRGVYEH